MKAQQLAESLLVAPSVGSVQIAALGRFRRWRIRQLLAGNYARTVDPTSAIADLSIFF